ncbi:hypothetical protein K501DRAFT_279526 [Backusella circina FSU 941]|nr:hypothetical protein K501DRAFT_279526 [Backusella circina FSU 941]
MYHTDDWSCFKPRKINPSQSNSLTENIKKISIAKRSNTIDFQKYTSPPLPPPRSNTTVNLARPLPPLPQNHQTNTMSPPSSLLKRKTACVSNVATKGQIQLKRAATWLGLPVQKIFASPKIHQISQAVISKYNSAGNVLFNNNSNCNNFPLNSDNIIQIPTIASTVSSSTSSSIDKDLMECNPEDIIYGRENDHYGFLSNIRNQLEQQQLQNDMTKANKKASASKISKTPAKRIMYCRVMQILNLGSVRDCNYEIQIQLNNVTMEIRKGVLRKIDKNTSGDRPQEEAIALEVEEPFSLTFIVYAQHTNTLLRDGLAKMGIWPIPATTEYIEEVDNDNLPAIGYTHLNFANKMDILDHGVSRFRLTKSSEKQARGLNIELLIDIKIEDILPGVMRRFLWSSVQKNVPDPLDKIMQELISDPIITKQSQKHCTSGDYLTIYTRSIAHPTWKRYWVVLKDDQLLLYDFTFKETKEALSVIPLAPLCRVSKPTVDDCENLGIARKTGVMLQFDRSRAMVIEPVRIDNSEGLEGKTYIYGDNEENTMHWCRALATNLISERMIETEHGIDLRFLW